MPLHSANIVVYSAYDDKTIAEVIFNKAIDGLGLSGNVSVKVLRKLNNLSEEEAEKLSVGQKILLPQPDNRKNERPGVNVRGKMRVK